MNARRRSASEKRAVVCRWLELRRLESNSEFGGRERAVRAVLSELRRAGAPIARATLFNWHSNYAARGILGLVDRRGGQPLDRSNDSFLQEARRLRQQEPRPTMAECYRLACEAATENGWELRSYKTTQRYLASIGWGRKGVRERLSKAVRAAFE